MWFKIGLKKSSCPGQRLGNYGNKLVALTGRLADCYYPRAMPWARSFCPFRACGVHLRNLTKGKKNPSQDKTLTGILILNLSHYFSHLQKMITSNHGW